MKGSIAVLAAACLALVSSCAADAKSTSTPLDDAPAMPSGTLAGKPFTARSGCAQVGKPNTSSCATETVTHLEFSTEEDTCAALQDERSAAGATYVMVYSICGTTPGTFESDDVKAYVLDPSDRTKGTRLANAVPGTSVTFTRVDAERVEGSLSLKLVDGSTVEGSFSVPTNDAINP